MAVHRNNVTVPEAVRQILTRNYPIYQCLKMKLTNFHAIAEYIQPQVQELTGRKTTINTLVVAIKRFSDTLAETKTLDTAKALANLRISLSGDVYPQVGKSFGCVEGLRLGKCVGESLDRYD